jgi:hypothetical protein
MPSVENAETLCGIHTDFVANVTSFCEMLRNTICLPYMTLMAVAACDP